MKKKTMWTLLIVGGLGFLLFRHFKKRGSALASQSTVVSDQAVQSLAAQYNVPEQTVKNLISSIKPGTGMATPERQAAKILAQGVDMWWR